MSISLTSQGQSKMRNPESKSTFRSTLVHLRFPFSFFLMPVFLFAVSQSDQVKFSNTILAFIILHLVVFPASNVYNSYHDHDSGSIGLIKNPPAKSITLLYAANFLDVIALVVSLFISIKFSLLVLIFIVVSRAYSNRKIRLKRFPFLSFLIVSFFQGAYVYMISQAAISSNWSMEYLLSQSILICMTISTLFIGSIYPLTQIYQHESDKDDGVITLSYLLGYTGSFIFSSILFILAIILLYFHFHSSNKESNFLLFSILMIPVVLYMVYWAYKVHINKQYADYNHAMIMNMVTAFFMNTFFTILIFK